MLYSILIAFMISFGFITTEADYQNLTPEEQTQYEVIVEDFDNI